MPPAPAGAAVAARTPRPSAPELISRASAAPRHPGLHVACTLGGTDLGRSGIGTCVREWLPRLISQLRADGGRLSVFGHPAELAAYAFALHGADQIPLRVVPLQPGLNALWHLTRSAAFARSLGADALLLPAANRRLTRSAALPTVAIVHDLAQLQIGRKYDRLRMTYFHRVLVPGFQRARSLVAVSQTTRRDLVERLGIPARRVQVVYNGVNAAPFEGLSHDSPRVATARRETGLADRPYLLYPARLEHPGKNHVRLLRAFAASGLAATHRLALSGADWGAGELLRALVRERHLEAAVTFLGYQPADRLPALIAGADAVLMLGLHEGFGLPALEGLCAGRPVCVANTGALPEVVGPLGVQCSPHREDAIAQALRRVTQDAALRARCEQDGPRWAARFSWDNTATGLLAACHDAVRQPA
ncbi:glycosyltransferase family 1 protein [Opitutus sp. ER46]|uniref:glycosyltransferase family 4 protein n=1 Tax=Opitutus sp. ER46 TaxID=2161864 RepID=UPI000D2F9727|nr:glycosyltransferase family 1 protein [Opitutus sp. ER46]PTX90729.1 hypothetical protein DB354_18885 [Opitutus sp. ER46]